MRALVWVQFEGGNKSRAESIRGNTAHRVLLQDMISTYSLVALNALFPIDFWDTDKYIDQLHINLNMDGTYSDFVSYT